MNVPEESKAGDIVVSVDAELRPLIGHFLEARRAEIAALRQAVGAGDLEALRAAGHRLKGVGGGYGFERLTELGKALEDRVSEGDLPGSGAVVETIADYVARVVVVYVDEP